MSELTGIDPTRLSHTETLMETGKEYVIPSSEHLATSDEVRTKLGLGIEAHLQVVVDLVPTSDGSPPAETLYVFDRGTDPRYPASLVEHSVRPDARSQIIPAGSANRYMIVTGTALARITESARNGWSYDHGTGYGMLGENGSVVIGRNAETDTLLGTPMRSDVSRQHLRISSLPNGSLALTDTSLHRTRIYMPY